MVVRIVVQIQHIVRMVVVADLTPGVIDAFHFERLVNRDGADGSGASVGLRTSTARFCTAATFMMTVTRYYDHFLAV